MRSLIVSQLLPDFAGCALGEMADPTCGPEDVLIRVEAAALGFNPPVCTENWDHEIHYHGFYRQWLKMLEEN